MEGYTKKVHTIDISWNLILKILLVAGALMIGARIVQVLITIFFAVVIASALMPIVKFLREKRIPNVISVILTYLSVGIVLFVIGSVIIRPIKADFGGFVSSIPALLDEFADSSVDLLNSLPATEVDKEQVLDYLNKFYETNLTPESILNGLGPTFSTITSLGGLVGSFIMSVVLSLYIILDHDSFLDIVLLRIIDDEQRNLVKELVEEVEQKLGRWLLSQFSLMLIIGFMSWAFLSVIRLKFALPLAAIAGLLTVIPSMGPLISAIPAIFVALFDRGLGLGIVVAIGYNLIQQIDNTFITPRIMGNLAGMKPLIVVIGVMIGLSVGGVLGAVMTVPILAIIKILYDFFIKLKRLKVIREN